MLGKLINWQAHCEMHLSFIIYRLKFAFYIHVLNSLYTLNYLLIHCSNCGPPTYYLLIYCSNCGPPTFVGVRIHAPEVVIYLRFRNISFCQIKLWNCCLRSNWFTNILMWQPSSNYIGHITLTLVVAEGACR